MRITDARHLRAIASPVRRDILDTVAALGALSVADLARRLGRPADRLYYHVRLLERVGLLGRSPSVAASGRDEDLFDVPARPIYIQYELGNARHRSAMRAMVGALLRQASTEFTAAYVPGEAVVNGPERDLWAGRVTGVLDRSARRRVVELVDELVAIFQSAGRRSTGGPAMHQLTFVLSPARRGK
jgi:DNA-binding transcriptional ArsR family regulator